MGPEMRRLAVIATVLIYAGLAFLPGPGRFLASGQELGPAGTPSRGVQSIQGIEGMRPVDVKQSGSSDGWTLQAVHQAVVSHVSSLTHVSGLISVRDDTCPTCKARVDHYNALANQPHISGAIRAWQVSQCGPTATIAVASNANRRDIYLRNQGTTWTGRDDGGNIFIGFGVTGHVALTAANGWVMHAGAHIATSTLILYNYQGPISCIGLTAGSTLGVLEMLR